MDEEQKQHTSRFERGASGGERADASDPLELQCVDLCPICRSADVLRATMPPEFHEHWQAWQREAMLALRAALDHYIAHLESERRGEPPVEDIPIG